MKYLTLGMSVSMMTIHKAAGLLGDKPPSADEAFNHHKLIPLHLQDNETPSATAPQPF